MALQDFAATNEDLRGQLGAEWAEDNWGQILLHTALYDLDISKDLREGAYAAFDRHMLSNYGLSFDDWFDWDAYREWYDTQ